MVGGRGNDLRVRSANDNIELAFYRVHIIFVIVLTEVSPFTNRESLEGEL